MTRLYECPTCVSLGYLCVRHRTNHTPDPQSADFDGGPAMSTGGPAPAPTAAVPPDANGLREAVRVALVREWRDDYSTASIVDGLTAAVIEFLAASEAAPTAGEEEAQYESLVASGLSDYEARESVWPSVPVCDHVCDDCYSTAKGLRP